MKKHVLAITICVLMAGIATKAQAETTSVAVSPKTEMRAAWFTTVWAIDWPATRNNTTAATAAQKKQMTDYFDELQAANMNTVFFQVRAMSDAYYQSSFQEEPWSQWLTGTRGGVPQYDPLEFAIAEAHKRGLELHAWINPYRYSSGTSTFGTLSTDYSSTHPDWLIDYGSNNCILNPGIPEVRQRIVAIVTDIVSRYDVDGIVFDDYFYVQGSTDAMDQAQYNAYNPNSLSRADWRRDNVNKMVAEVYAAIKAEKPWCQFGIGPAGIAASTKSVADKYGITPCNFGEGDWQYNGIYSEPVAWLQAGTIDYISPQVYWTIGSTNDFSKISPWWYQVAYKFNRHCYISHSLSNLHKSFLCSEMLAQVEVNRGASNTCGSVFYQTSNLSQEKLLDTLLITKFTHKAILPAMTWYTAPSYEAPANLDITGNILSWTSLGGRFTVYAYPKDVLRSTALASAEYLLGVTYSTEFDVSGYSTSDYNFAVRVYDRYGNEHTPGVLGSESEEPTTCNPYGWKLKGEMCLALQNDYNAAYGTAKQWAKAENGQIYYKLGDQWIPETDAIGSEATTTNFIQYITYSETANFTNLLLTQKWQWLADYVTSVREAQGLTTDMSDNIYRKEVSAFFLCSPANTSWPASANYATAGLETNFVSAWGNTFCTAYPTDEEPLNIYEHTLDWTLPVFNILGQQVSKGYKGIVLQNGVKYLLQ